MIIERRYRSPSGDFQWSVGGQTVGTLGASGFRGKLANREASVMDFGATGSGDDTAAIQRAIDSGAGVVLFPGGFTFTAADLVLPSGIELIGAGTLKKAAGSSGYLLSATGKSGIRISIAIDGNGSNQSGNHADVWFDECSDVVFGSVVTNGNGTALSVYGAVTFNECEDCVVLPQARVIGARYDALFFKGGARHWVGGSYRSNGYSGVATQGATDVSLHGVFADANGTSNITLNGPRNRAIGCTGTNSVANSGINIGHDIAGQDASYSEVIGGYYAGNAQAGVNILGGATQDQTGIKVIGVTCEDNEDGIKTAEAIECLIESNILIDNTLDGLRLEGDRNEAHGNHMRNNGRYGLHIFAAASADNDITGNRYSGQGTDVVDNGTGTVT